jgi:inner membrane protein
MADGPTHRFAAAVIVGSSMLHLEKGQEQGFLPIIGAAVAACLGDLPDRLEPAIHPNHRQIYHSIVVGILIGALVIRIYRWEPVPDWQKAVRLLSLAGCGAYLVHLALDAFSPRSLPLMGRI